MFSLTADNLFRSLLQCVIVKGTFLSDKQPQLQGCFEGQLETWTHNGVSIKLIHSLGRKGASVAKWLESLT